MPGKTTPGPPPRRDGMPAQGKTQPSHPQDAELRLPHERDGSPDSHPGTNDPRVEQAARDAESGQQDTGRGPVVNKLAKTHFPSSDSGRKEKKKPDRETTQASRDRRKP